MIFYNYSQCIEYLKYFIAFFKTDSISVIHQLQLSVYKRSVVVIGIVQSAVKVRALGAFHNDIAQIVSVD